MNETTQEPSSVRYVTYTSDGTLDGCYFQVPTSDHIDRMVVVDEQLKFEWVCYKANTARDGVELIAVVPVTLVPESVAMWQARAILIEDNLLDTVNAVLAAIADDKARKLAQAKFEYSSTVRRDDPLVTEVFPQLGKTETEINQMFIRATAL